MGAITAMGEAKMQSMPWAFKRSRTTSAPLLWVVTGFLLVAASAGLAALYRGGERAATARGAAAWTAASSARVKCGPQRRIWPSRLRVEQSLHGVGLGRQCGRTAQDDVGDQPSRDRGQQDAGAIVPGRGVR